MKKIIIEIECGTETCDQCKFLYDNLFAPVVCTVFNKDIKQTWEISNRLPECLNAEVKQNDEGL